MRLGHRLQPLFAAAISMVVVLVGCRGSVDRPEPHDLSDLNRPGYRVAVLADTREAALARVFFSFARIVPVEDLSMAATALLGGRVEAIACDEHRLRQLMNANPDRMKLLDPPLDESPAVIHLAPSRTNLVVQLNGFIRRLRRAGVYDEMLARWCYDPEPPSMPDVGTEPNPRGTLRVGASGLREPLSYLDAAGEPVGFDIEFVRRFARDRRMACQVFLMPEPSLRHALSEGLLDLVADGWTADSAGSDVVVSDPYLDSDVRVVVLRTDDEARDRAISDFTDGLCAGFMNAFVTDSRWRLILYGLWLTLMMTFLSAVSGLVLAFGVCALRMGSRHWARRFAAGYITALQGTPVLIVLLILSCIVFAGTGVDGIVCAVITLSLWFSANAAETLRAGIRAVQRGQYEAAIALGLPPVRAFVGVVLPQALRVALPVLSGGIVNLLQQTSIVGYIAVLDLTMAVDLLCGRSAHAVVPLVATGATYFLVSWLIVRALDACGRALDPARRRRRKGGARC